MKQQDHTNASGTRRSAHKLPQEEELAHTTAATTIVVQSARVAAASCNRRLVLNAIFTSFVFSLLARGQSTAHHSHSFITDIVRN